MNHFTDDDQTEARAEARREAKEQAKIERAEANREEKKMNEYFTSTNEKTK